MIAELKDKKILVIVESPNKVAHVKEYLQKAGYNIRVAASVGHIAEIKNGGSYYNTGIEPSKDFEMDLAVSDDKRDVVKNLKAQVDWADLVYLATDGDNEGAQISWSLIKFLKLPKTKYRRMITHEITPKAVVKALENPVALDTDNAMASQARMVLDKMTGYRLSPIAKTYVGAKSVGRCQSAGLKLVVDREKEIQNFKPETYFNLYLHFKKNKTEFKAKYCGTNTEQIDRLTSKALVDKIKRECCKDYIIEGVAQKQKEEAPKPPFATATFQQEAASKLNLKVKDAMQIAQYLFENGFITYHRTDDTSFAPEFVPTLQAYIEKTYGKKAWTKPRVGKKQEGAQEGHECLRVTDPAMTPEDFAKIEPKALYTKVYRLIWQRTIAAALPNAIISETGYLIDNNGQKFLLVSNEVLDEGYRKVYSYKDEKDPDADDDGPVKETFKKGEVLKDTELEDVKKETRPPARFSEATFIKELQKREIGRPSTYATIVETVLSPTRGYAEIQEKVIVPTERGIQLINFLDRAFSNIINIDYTKQMEKDLDLIASGKLDKLKFLKTFYTTLEETVSKNTEMGLEATAEPKTCPKCGAPMIVRRSRFGKLFYGCSKYPKCNGIINLD